MLPSGSVIHGRIRLSALESPKINVIQQPTRNQGQHGIFCVCFDSILSRRYAKNNKRYTESIEKYQEQSPVVQRLHVRG